MKSANVRTERERGMERDSVPSEREGEEERTRVQGERGIERA